MTKEEAWLFWMANSKNTDVPVNTDFSIIKKTSWWAAFEAGWDAGNANTEAFDIGYKMGRQLHEWVGLTDEEIGTLTVFDGLTHIEVPILADFIRAIEAKLKEKNCSAANNS